MEKAGLRACGSEVNLTAHNDMWWVQGRCRGVFTLAKKKGNPDLGIRALVGRLCVKIKARKILRPSAFCTGHSLREFKSFTIGLSGMTSRTVQSVPLGLGSTIRIPKIDHSSPKHMEKKCRLMRD